MSPDPGVFWKFLVWMVLLAICIVAWVSIFALVMWWVN